MQKCVLFEIWYEFVGLYIGRNMGPGAEPQQGWVWRGEASPGKKKTDFLYKMNLLY